MKKIFIFLGDNRVVGYLNGSRMHDNKVRHKILIKK